MKYARITIPGRRPFYLQITAETDTTLDGIEVNDEGDEVVPAGRNAAGQRYTERRHIIAKDAIRRRQPHVISPTYGTLIPDPNP